MTIVLFLPRSNASLMRVSNSCSDILSLSIHISWFLLMATRIWFFSSGFLAGLFVCGSCTACPFWSMGVTTMKMIRSTSTTSTRGVTLMSDLTLPLLSSIGRPVLLQEEVDELGGRVGHLDLEPLQTVGEIVERHDRGDR